MSVPVWAWFLIVGIILGIVIIAVCGYAIYHFVCKKRKPAEEETDQSVPEPVMVKVATLKRPSSSQSLSTEKVSRGPPKIEDKVEERTGGKKTISVEKAPKSKEKLEKSTEKTKPPSKAPEPVKEMSPKGGSVMRPASKMEAPGENRDNVRSKRSLDKMNEIWDVDFDTVTTNSNTKRPTLQDPEPAATGAKAAKARARKTGNTRSTNK